MRHRLVPLASALTLLVIAARLAAQAPDKRLTIADVEKVAAVSGVTLVPRLSQPGAGGDLNFATADGKLLAMVNFGNAALYTKARTQKEMKIGDKTYPMELYAHAVPNVGDEAFDSPPGKDQYVIYAHKADKAISVSTYLNAGKPRLTIPQLAALAQTIFSRW